DPCDDNIKRHIIVRHGSVEAAPGTRTLQEEKTQMLKKLKGIGLLLITNFLIMIMLGVVYVVLANSVLPAFGIDIRGSVDGTILLYASVLGFGGTFISLAFSKQLARAMLDCYQLTEPRIRPSARDGSCLEWRHVHHDRAGRLAEHLRVLHLHVGGAVL